MRRNHIVLSCRGGPSTGSHDIDCTHNYMEFSATEKILAPLLESKVYTSEGLQLLSALNAPEKDGDNILEQVKDVLQKLSRTVLERLTISLLVNLKEQDLHRRRASQCGVSDSERETGTYARINISILVQVTPV